MRSPPRTLRAARTRLPLPKVRHAPLCLPHPAQNTRSPRRADIKECSAEIVHNASVPILVEAALQRESGSYLTSTGALAVRSGAKTGRSPKDKRIVEESASVDNVWWGPVNIKIEEKSFMLNRECAARLHTHPHNRCVQRAHPRLSPWQARPRLPPHARSDLRRGRLRRLGPQVPRQRARALLARLPRSVHEEHAGETLAPRLWHADGATTPARLRSACVLQVEVSPADLDAFVPDLVIINAGGFPANRYVDGVSSSCTVDLHLGRYSKRFNRTQVGAPQPQPAPRALGSG